MALRTGPDADFRLLLNDPIGLQLSGLGAPLQLQIEGVQWSRRKSALQIDGMALEHGTKQMVFEHVQLDGGAFPWLGLNAPRSLTLTKVSGWRPSPPLSALSCLPSTNKRKLCAPLTTGGCGEGAAVLGGH